MTYTSYSIISHIQQQLFSHEEKRIQDGTQRMVQAAKEILKSDIPGFMYDGIFYPNRERLTPIKPTDRKPVLPKELEAEMALHMADVFKVVSDRQTIWQAIYKLLEPCDTLQDLRDALPKCLDDILPQDFRGVDRQQPEMFTIQNDHRTERLVNKALPLMKFYTAARLIY